MQILKTFSAALLAAAILLAVFSSAQAGGGNFGSDSQRAVMGAMGDAAVAKLAALGENAKVKTATIWEDISFSIVVTVKGEVKPKRIKQAIKAAYAISGEVEGVSVIRGVAWYKYTTDGNTRIVIAGCFAGELCELGEYYMAQVLEQ